MESKVNVIIIAAGMGKRLRPHTIHFPKCMLDVGGKTLLQRQLDAYRACGINDISIIRGHQRDKINLPDLHYFDNTNYMANNILNSLFYAEEKIVGETICGYSDILFDQEVVATLLKSREDISIVVDTDWHVYYEGRMDHPETEAEKVVFNKMQKVKKIGKGIGAGANCEGEFIGMLKVSQAGAKLLKTHFHIAKQRFSQTPFQAAPTFEKAYITDILQEMVDNGISIHCTLIQRGWKEIDTVEDYEKAILSLSG
jgi:choline kinase